MLACQVLCADTPCAAEWREQLAGNQGLLRIPDDHPELANFRSVLGDLVQSYTLRPGVFVPAVMEKTGGVYRVDIPGGAAPSGWAPVWADPVDAALNWCERTHNDCVREAGRFVQLRDLPPDSQVRQPDDPRSADLAAALAVARKILGTDLDDLRVCASGQCGQGEILPVDYVREKAEAILREVPQVDCVFVPRAQEADWRDILGDRVVPVATLAEALADLERRIAESIARLNPTASRVRRVPAASVASPDPLSALALEWPVQQARTKLVFRIPTDRADLSNPPPGWIRSRINNLHFSKCGIRERREWRDALADVLLWSSDEAGVAEVPVVHRLDLNVLKNRLNLDDPPSGLRLTDVDLIPVQDRTAFLGLSFDGRPGSVRRHLEWVSSRLFGGRKFIARPDDPAGWPLFKVMTEWQRAMQEGRRPDGAADCRSSNGTPPVAVFHCVGSPESWHAAGMDPVADRVMDLLSTASRPRLDVPPKPHGFVTSWEHPRARNTRYACAAQPHIVTAWCDASDAFNRTNKPAVFSTANYTQWLTALLLLEHGRDPEPFVRLFDEELRADFFVHACDALRYPLERGSGPGFHGGTI